MVRILMIRPFLITQVIDGHAYSGEICARDWHHAETIARMIGATIVGEKVGEACAICGSPLSPQETEADPSFFDSNQEIPG